MDTTALHIDSSTLSLGAVVALLLALAVYLRPAPPQAHPFLLGRQSAVAPTRLPNESPVYTSSATGGVRAPIRPDKRLKTLKDVLDLSQTCLEGGNRGNWVKGGEKLGEVVKALRAGLLNALGPGPGLVAVLAEDPTDALLVTLALALTPHKPLVISPGSNLPSTAPVTAIIQSSTLFSTAQSLSATPDAKWISLGGAGEASAAAEDLLATGRALIADGKEPEATEAEPKGVAVTIVSEGVPLDLTHLNLTSALVSWLSIFPASPRSTRPAISDSLVSFHHPSTPYGFGLALLAIHTNAALFLPTLGADADPEYLAKVFLASSSPPPTLIFAPASLVASPLYTLFLQSMLGDSAFIVRQSRSGKLRLLRSGIVTTTSFWDRLLFAGVRKDTGMTKLRLLVLEGAIEQNRLETFRSVLGVPCISTLGHAFFLAPVSAGLMWDVQRLPPPQGDSPTAKSNVGPPIVGVEMKLRGEETEISAGRIKGEIVVRTPLLPPPWTLPSSLLLHDTPRPQLPAYPGKSANEEDHSGKWLRTGVKAEMGREGVLWLV